MQKKEYFKEPSVTKITRGYEPFFSKGKFVEEIQRLKKDQFLIILNSILPENYKTPREFLKHGSFVELATPDSLEEAVSNHMFPWKLREKAFDSLDSVYFAGYTFKPFEEYQSDKRERRVRLVECLEAERIRAYGYQTSNDIMIRKVYDKASRVSKDGARIRVSVPSRRKKQKRYEFYLDSIPLDGSNPNKFAIVNGFYSTISMPAQEHFWRHNYYAQKEDSKTFNIFAHEITAYYKVMFEQYYGERQNITPLEMSPFPIPTRLTREFYKKIISMALIHDERLKSKNKLRRLNKAEQEILLWSLVKKFGYNKTMFSKESIDGKLQEADWELPRAA